MEKILITRTVKAEQNKIRKQTYFCIAVGAAALLLNVLFTALRTAENHTVMLILNIVTDIAAGFFITYYVGTAILPRKKCLQFSVRETEKLSGTVLDISARTNRVLGFDCYTVTLSGGQKVFLPDCGNIELEAGGEVTLGIVMNVITEVER